MLEGPTSEAREPREDVGAEMSELTRSSRSFRADVDEDASGSAAEDDLRRCARSSRCRRISWSLAFFASISALRRASDAEAELDDIVASERAIEASVGDEASGGGAFALRDQHLSEGRWG